MTGSAYQAMDVFDTRDSLYRVGVWGRDWQAVFLDPRLADCLQNLSPKSAKINEKSMFFNDFSNFWRSVLERFLERVLGRFLDRFWSRFGIGFWKGFGLILERFLEWFWRCLGEAF